MTVRRAAIATALLVLTALSLGATPSTAEEGEPSLTVDRTGAKAGEAVIVRGSGWTDTDLVYVELCGNAGRNGTRSCDQGHATLSGLAADGSFAASLTIGTPPAPCPCVVKATSQTTHAFATASLAIQDVPVIPLEDQAVLTLLNRSLDIADARLTGRGPWTSWFGSGAERTLVLTVVNTGDVAVHDPPLTITAGKGAVPKGIVRAPDLGTIEPGESVVVEVPVRFSALAFGQHSARASISGFAEPIEARAATSTYPWALIAIALVLVQLGLLRLRNLARARVTPHGLDDGSDDGTDDDDRSDDDSGHEPPPASEAPSQEAPSQEAPSTDPVVIDLRGVPVPDRRSSIEPPARAEADHHVDHGAAHQEDHLPNPFDQVFANQITGAIELVNRHGVEVRSAHHRSAAQRHAAEESLAAVRADATSILSSAASRADALFEEASTMRAAAAATVEDARRETQALLDRVLATVEEVDRDALHEHDAIRRAAEGAKTEIAWRLAEATRRIDQLLAAAELEASAVWDQPSSAADEILLPRREVATLRPPARRTGTGLDSAIERAVQRALQA